MNSRYIIFSAKKKMKKTKQKVLFCLLHASFIPFSLTCFPIAPPLFFIQEAPHFPLFFVFVLNLFFLLYLNKVIIFTIATLNKKMTHFFSNYERLLGICCKTIKKLKIQFYLIDIYIYYLSLKIEIETKRWGFCENMNENKEETTYQLHHQTIYFKIIRFFTLYVALSLLSFLFLHALLFIPLRNTPLPLCL